MKVVRKHSTNMIGEPSLHNPGEESKYSVSPSSSQENIHCMSDREGDILIVDDNYFNIEVLEELVESNFSNCKFESCFSGFEAIDLINKRVNHQGPIYNVFLFDINMPEMSGFQLERKVGEILTLLNGNHRTVIAAVTAQENLQENAEWKENTFDGIIHKPVRYEDLLELLDS